MPQIPPAPRGAPDVRSPARFIAWIARGQLRNICSGALFGILWMGSQALIPAVLGEAIEAVVKKNDGALVRWSLLLFGLGCVSSAAGILRHRRAVWNYLLASTRVQLVVAKKASELGADLARHVAAGEVASLGATDVERIGDVLDVTARLSGAVVSYIAVATILLFESPLLGLVVVLGVPVALLVIGPLTRPLERRQTAERERRAEASSLAADTVVGLRILRGLGRRKGVRREVPRSLSEGSPCIGADCLCEVEARRPADPAARAAAGRGDLAGGAFRDRRQDHGRRARRLLRLRRLPGPADVDVHGGRQLLGCRQGGRRPCPLGAAEASGPRRSGRRCRCGRRHRRRRPGRVLGGRSGQRRPGRRDCRTAGSSRDDDGGGHERSGRGGGTGRPVGPIHRPGRRQGRAPWRRSR